MTATRERPPLARADAPEIASNGSVLQNRTQRGRQTPGRERVPPHSPEAEDAVLGAVMLSAAALTDVLAVGLVSGDFYPPRHQATFEAIVSLCEKGQPIDVLTVAEELQRRGLLDQVGGLPALHRLQNATPPISNAGHHARIVRDKATSRRMIEFGFEVQEGGFREDNAWAARSLERAQQRLCASASAGARQVSVEDVWGQLRDGLNPTPNPTILARTDDKGVIHEHTSVVLFGPGGAGKTWVVLSAAFSGVMLGHRVAWIDLDNMGLTQLVARLAMCGIGSNHVTSNTLSYFEGGRFDTITALLTAVESADPEMVVVDSLIGLLALAGVESENDNGAVRAVLQRLRDRLSQHRPRTFIVIDHTGHDAGRARGASAKRDWADQQVEVVVTDPLGVGQVGRLRLVSRKDRRGHFPDGSPMADVVVDSTSPMREPLTHLGHSTRIALYEPAATAAGDPRVMKMILDGLLAAGGEAQWADLKRQKPLRAVHKTPQAAARNALLNDGQITETRGPNNSIKIALSKVPA